MAIPRVLSIAGTDPTGGAGIHADIKSITAAGGYAMGAVTALVSQNTHGVTDVHYPDASVLTTQLEAVSADVIVDAVKIGMLGQTAYIDAVNQWLEKTKPPIVVIDPVMVATSGDRLIDEDAEQHLRQLFHRATVLTPNTPELEILAGCESGSILSDEGAIDAARTLAQQYDVLVAVKGGHLDGERIINHLVAAHGIVATTMQPRIQTKSTHGTGCSQSSALATRLAAGENPQDALGWVTRWLHDSMRAADELQVGTGHGPIDHSHRARTLAAHALSTPWLSQTVDLQAFASDPSSDLLLHADAVARYRIQPAGQWTRLLAQLTHDILEQTLFDDFLTGLREGTLETWEFTAYQRQDTHYLNRYARALAALAARASDPVHTVFWSSGSASAISVEQVLHHTWLAEVTGEELTQVASMAITPITAGYTNHLLANTALESYVVGAAAVLPCYWMYAEIGLRLSEINTEDHPYHAWLTTYQDEAFTRSTQQAIAIVESLLAAASAPEREQAMRAFIEASLWEREFFDQASRMR